MLNQNASRKEIVACITKKHCVHSPTTNQEIQAAVEAMCSLYTALALQAKHQPSVC